MGTSVNHFECCGLNHEGSRDASEEPGAVWLVLGVITDYFQGAWSLATGNLPPLSEQQFEDCDMFDFGCNGELMNNGFALAVENAMCMKTGPSNTGTREHLQGIRVAPSESKF